MAFGFFKIIKGLVVRKEASLTADTVTIIPNGTASTNTTVQTSQTVNRTLTLPDATDTLVGKATIDTFTNKTFDADGTGNSITNIENADIKVAAAIDAAKLANGSVSNTEYQYLDGVTSSIQTQLNAKGDLSSSVGTSVDSEIVIFDGTTGKLVKRATGTGVAHVTSGVLSASNVVLTTEVTGVLPVANGGTNSSASLNNNRIIQSSGSAIVEAAAITANRALISDANGIPTQSITTATELTYVNGVTSAIQTQLNNKQATGNYITALTGDITASGPGSSAATLATVNGNVGSFTSANITVNAKGLVTAASNGSGSSNLAVTSQTTTYAIQTNDDVILCSGSAFTATLPTAVGVTGKQYIIEKTDSSFTNVITIATTSSQTIGAGGGTTTTLNTQGESLSLYSDGTNWQIRDRRIPAIPTTYTMTIGASVTPPTKGTTSVDLASYTRIGSFMKINYTLEQTGSGSDGSGVYRFPIPSGLTINSSAVPYTTSDEGSVVGSASALTDCIGFCKVFDSTNLILMVLQQPGSSGLVQSGGFGRLSISNMRISFEAMVPITGWNG